MNSDFLRAWRLWIRCDRPIENSRRRRGDALSYAIEVELDHLLSDVHTIGGYAISGKHVNFRELVLPELRQLDALELELADCPLSQTERNRFEACFGLTRSLLQSLADVGGHPITDVTSLS